MEALEIPGSEDMSDLRRNEEAGGLLTFWPSVGDLLDQLACRAEVLAQHASSVGPTRELCSSFRWARNVGRAGASIRSFAGAVFSWHVGQTCGRFRYSKRKEAL